MLLRVLACAIVALAHLQPALADVYPTRPLRFINPTAPGGTAEPIARVIALKLSENLGQSVVVDSRGGAGGTVGTAMAEQLRVFLRTEIKKFAEVVEIAGAKID